MEHTESMLHQQFQGFVNPTFNSPGTNLNSKMSNEIPGGLYISTTQEKEKSNLLSHLSVNQ